jgi:type I restriction enzyme S subunit
VPAAIPPGWAPRSFGDCARLVRRRVDPQATPDAPYVGLEHIGVGTLHLVGVGRCGDVAGPAQRVEPGDVLFGKLRPYFRKVVRAREPLVCTEEAWVLAPKDGVDGRFLFYLAADPAFVDACAAAAAGSRMPRTDWAFASAWPVALPPLDEQRRIGATLGALDDKIVLLRAMNDTLEAIARALFASWFVRDGPVDAAGWAVGSLADVADRVREPVRPSALPPDAPYVGFEHAPRRSAALYDWGRAAAVTDTKLRFRAGDTLFGALRPNLHKVVPAPMDGVTSAEMFVVRARDDAWRWFVYGLLSADATIAHASAAADGTRMPRARWADLCGLPVRIPPRARAAAFGAVVEPLYARVAHNARVCRTLAELRDTLLPKLLSGAVPSGGPP